MRSTTPLVLGIAFGSILFASPFVWADAGNRCDGRQAHAMSHSGGIPHSYGSTHLLRHLLKNKQDLALTDDQIAKLRTVALDADRARIRAEADVLVSKRELRSLLWDEKAEMPAIEAKVKEHEAMEATAHIIGIRAKRELLSVLTTEQRAKQKTLWEQHRQHASGHMMRTDAGSAFDESNDLKSTMDAFEVEVIDSEDSSSAG